MGILFCKSFYLFILGFIRLNLHADEVGRLSARFTLTRAATQ